jgi:hypothetical protein
MIRDVGIVVLSYGTDRSADGLIANLLADGHVSRDQVVEVHNPSELGEVARPKHDSTVINLRENGGYAAGMNAGIRAVADRYPFILLLTHDAGITGIAVAELRDALASRPELAIVGPLLATNGRLWSAGKTRQANWRYTHIVPEVVSNDVDVVDSLDGSVLLVRTSFTGSLFDERFFMYFEETDAIERLRVQRIGRAAIVMYVFAESSPGGSKRPQFHAYLMARNGLEVARRYAGRGAVVQHLVFLARDSARQVIRGADSEPGSLRGRLLAARCALARLEGVRDFRRKRFGAPPLRLRDGDT